MRPILLFLLSIYPLISAATPTKIKFYRPFGEVVNQVKPKIVSQKQGQCFQQSKRIIREEAWRCESEGVVYDPCFVKPGGNEQEVLCLQSPWSEEAVLIQTTMRLEVASFIKLDVSTAYPWAVLLSSGEKCLATGNDQQLEGEMVHYQCSDQSLLVGYLQRCREEWSILKKNSKQEIATAVLRKAWF